MYYRRVIFVTTKRPHDSKKRSNGSWFNFAVSTSSHVKPSKLEKMNVRLATQLFSRSVAIGMKFYREQREPGLKDSEGTEMFTMQVNDLFDVLNAKHPATGIRKNSPKIKVMGFLMLIVLYYESNILKGAFVCHATGDRRLPGHAE
uniref:Putative transposable element n=1 Tax=Rhipicephalus microplus TaxID=6941 RepID=A0A6G5AFU0_RHIMP